MDTTDTISIDLDVVVTPGEQEPNGCRFVEVWFKRMVVNIGGAEASSEEPVAPGEDEYKEVRARGDDRFVSFPSIRPSFVRVLHKLIRTRITLSVKPDGDVQYVSGDDFEGRAEKSLFAIGSRAQMFSGFAVRQAIRSVRGEAGLLPPTPVGKGALWYSHANDLSSGTKGHDCDVRVRLPDISESGGHKVASLSFSTLVKDDTRKKIGNPGDFIVATGTKVKVTGTMKFDLDARVTTERKLKEEGTIDLLIEEMKKQQITFCNETTITVTKAPAPEKPAESPAE
jgi:hypothetical protein